MILTLSFSVGFENLEVRAAPDALTAGAHIDALHEDRTAFVFDTDLPDWLGAQLYERYTCGQLPALFNAARDPSVPPVNKFEDKPTALRRLAAQLVARAKAAPPIPAKLQPKEPSMPRQPGPLGAFKPMRRDSLLARLVAATLEGPQTLASLGERVGLNPDVVRASLVAGRRTHGVDSTVAEDGSVAVILPPPDLDPFVAPAAKPERVPRSAPKVGEFSPIRRNSPMGNVVAAAIGAQNTLAQIVAGIPDMTEENALAALKRARSNNGIAFAVDPDTGIVSLTLPVPADDLFQTPKPKAERPTSGERRPRGEGKEPRSLAEFRPVKPNTIRSRLCSLMDGTRTVAQLASETGLTNGNASSHVFCLWRDCGMGFRFDAEGRVSLVLPEGATSHERAAA